MKNKTTKPNLYKRIYSRDLATFYEVSYQTGNKKFNLIAAETANKKRVLYLLDLLKFEGIEKEDAPLFLKEFYKKVYGIEF